jgi:hypothetical protein
MGALRGRDRITAHPPCPAPTPHLTLRFETIQLGEQLVDGVVALVIPRAGAPPGAPHGIQLINEDDAWSQLARLFQES